MRGTAAAPDSQPLVSLGELRRNPARAQPEPLLPVQLGRKADRLLPEPSQADHGAVRDERPEAGSRSGWPKKSERRTCRISTTRLRGCAPLPEVHSPSVQHRDIVTPGVDVRMDFSLNVAGPPSAQFFYFPRRLHPGRKPDPERAGDAFEPDDRLQDQLHLR